MNHFRWIMAAVLTLASSAEAEFTFIGDVQSSRRFPDRVEFVVAPGRFNLYICDGNILRFRFTQKDEFSAAPSYAVVAVSRPAVAFDFTEHDSEYVVQTKELTVRISKSPCRIAIYDSTGNLLNADDPSFGVAYDNAEVRCFKKILDGESFYGLGEKSDDLRKNGNEYTLWNSDFPAYTGRTDPLYLSIPFYIGVRNFKAYGIFMDNPWRSHFNFGAGNNRFSWFGAEQGEMDYYFIYGPEIKRVISSYTMLTGRMQMPPLWSLGYQQSRWSYYPESEVRAIAANFRTRKIPCDAIYLDIHYMDGYRVFTWDKRRFPDPPKMLADLKSNGFNVITIIDPGIKADTNYFAAKEGIARNLFAKYPGGSRYEGEVWPSWSYFPDFTKSETRSWWGEKLSVLMKDGIEGFWNDMNEPAVWGQRFPDIVRFDDNGFGANHKKIHNVYALEMARATDDGIGKYSGRRRFVLSRAGFAGIQRYSANWTGDNAATEEHLRLACTMPLGIGVSGQPFIGSDVGGFIGYPSQRLYVRWMELGAFTPLFRGHSAYGEPAKEPWALGDDVESAVRSIIETRYRFLPYLYSEFYAASQTGCPIMRPMFLDFQNDAACYERESQYQFMLGDNLLVAPVVSEKDETRHLYLPAGPWYELNSKEMYDGGKWMLVDAPLSMIPLFLREGGIVPMQEAQQYVGEKKITETEVLIYPSDGSRYSLYEDDGISFDYKKGKYSITAFECRKKEGKIEIKIEIERNGYATGRKDYLFKIISAMAPANVTAAGERLAAVKSMDGLKATQSGFYYNADEKIVYVKTEDRGGFSMQVEF